MFHAVLDDGSYNVYVEKLQGQPSMIGGRSYADEDLPNPFRFKMNVNDGVTPRLDEWFIGTSLMKSDGLRDLPRRASPQRQRRTGQGIRPRTDREHGRHGKGRVGDLRNARNDLRRRGGRKPRLVLALVFHGDRERRDRQGAERAWGRGHCG